MIVNCTESKANVKSNQPRKQTATMTSAAAAVLLVSALCISHQQAHAFQINPTRSVVQPRKTQQQQLTSLHGHSTVSSTMIRSTIDDSITLPGLGAHERRNNPLTPSHMFLKSGQWSNQPMASLSSDFFYGTATTTTSNNKHGDNVLWDVLLPTKRDRGTLGFAIQDRGDQVISTCKQPPSVSSETSSSTSTRLHSSTDHSQEQQQSLDLTMWKTVPFGIDDEEWLTSAKENSSNKPQSNPILNRSPNSSTNSNSYNIEEAASSTAPAWFPWMPTITQIEALKVRELKRICADRGLIQTGNKVELQQRLWDWTRSQQHRQRRLMIGSNTLGNPVSGKKYRIEAATREMLDKQEPKEKAGTADSANSLEEWARTYDIEPLLQRREKIHKEKREGKAVKKPKSSKHHSRRSLTSPTKEYLSKLFDAPPAQYSNLEVKQMYAAAKAADQNGDRKLSKQILHKLKDATPHDARIYRRLSRMESEEGNVGNARKVLQEGIRLHPNNAHLWHGLGQLEVKAGDDDVARKWFLKAIQLDPAFPNPYHALGTSEHSKGQIAKAMKVLKAGLEYCPTNHRLHHALGDLYREAKMLEMAEKSFRRALEHGPEVSHGFAYTSLSHVAYERGDINGCRSWLRKAVALNKGRSAKAWLSLARLEESEGKAGEARTICMAALNLHEKHLLDLAKKRMDKRSDNLEPARFQDPMQLRNQAFASVPKYRSGDQFIKVYRNWARLEEKYGDEGTVDGVYSRATLAFPMEWKMPLDWALYHARNGHHDRARLLFSEACDTASNKHADPYRLFAEFEMSHGMYHDARKILYHGALVMSDAADGTLGNQGGMAELFHTWAVCEWHLENLPRAEVLFDHSLRLTKAGDEGSMLRSSILYSIARLEFEIGEYHLAQHCLCLCLKENALPGGNSRVWELWADVAEELGDEHLSEQCSVQASLCAAEQEEFSESSLSVLKALKNPDSSSMKEAEVQEMMRKDPWHYKVFERRKSDYPFSSVCLPEGRDYD